MDKLTKEADWLISKLYRVYLERRNSGTQRFESKYFGDCDDVAEMLGIENRTEDIADIGFELSRFGLIDCLPADNQPTQIFITDSAISYMENRFKNGLADVIDYLSKIVGILH